MLPPFHIGCSGWSYRHWRGPFYPPDLPTKRWFAFYADRFDAVEINNSFYRLPSEQAFRDWAAQAPPGFRYAVKMHRFLTHARKLKDADEVLTNVLPRVRLLGASLGPILYQLPPHWHFDRGRLADFLARLPRDLTHVIEVREPSWLVPEMLAMLDDAGVSFCAHDMPGLETPRWAAGPIAYVRFHGATGKYWGRYPEKRLRGWLDWMRGQQQQGRAVWAFFNNDPEGQAIEDALALKRLAAE